MESILELTFSFLNNLMTLNNDLIYLRFMIKFFYQICHQHKYYL